MDRGRIGRWPGKHPPTVSRKCHELLMMPVVRRTQREEFSWTSRGRLSAFSS
jgi:hypothetical protein